MLTIPLGNGTHSSSPRSNTAALVCQADSAERHSSHTIFRVLTLRFGAWSLDVVSSPWRFSSWSFSTRNSLEKLLPRSETSRARAKQICPLLAMSLY